MSSIFERNSSAIVNSKGEMKELRATKASENKYAALKSKIISFVFQQLLHTVIFSSAGMNETIVS